MEVFIKEIILNILFFCEPFVFSIFFSIFEQKYKYKYNDYDKQKNDIRAEFGVFIDGTLNNLKNTETRKKIRGKKTHPWATIPLPAHSLPHF